MKTDVELPVNRREQEAGDAGRPRTGGAAALGEKGYEQTTVEEIADVAVRTFFRYFSSKQHVLFGDVAHDRVTRLRSELAARPRDEPVLASVRAVLEAIDIADPEEQQQIMVGVGRHRRAAVAGRSAPGGLRRVHRRHQAEVNASVAT